MQLPEVVYCPKCGDRVDVAQDLGAFNGLVQEGGFTTEVTSQELYAGSCITCSAGLIWGLVSNPGLGVALTLTWKQA